ATLIERELAREGLLPPLARAIAVLDPRVLSTQGTAGIKRVTQLGFPTDLLRHFRLPGLPEGATDRPTATLGAIAQRLAQGIPVDRVREEVRHCRFEFVPSEPSFAVATEGGDSEVGMIRCQFGGGWRDGMVQGEALDAVR